MAPEHQFLLVDADAVELTTAFIRRLHLGAARWEVLVRPHKHKRSSKQNRRYWALLRDIAEQLRPNGQRFSEQSYHEYFKERMIGMEEIALPNGKTRLVAISTTRLTTAEFADYTTEIEAWAAGRGVRFQ